MDWSKVPDLVAIALLICAFASVARKNHTHQSKIWLIAWLMIAVHFAALALASATGGVGQIAAFVVVAALTSAGVLFMWAAVPHHNTISSRWLLTALLAANVTYPAVIAFAPAAQKLLAGAALLFLLPLIIALASFRVFRHWLRWVVVGMNIALSTFLLLVQSRPNGADLSLNAVLFVVYLGCCLHYLYTHKKGTTGGFLTILGFIGWAAVFLIGPLLAYRRPSLHLQDEIWNLPKYVVAVGMILLLLEDQIAENRHLALHDPLTALPNRRLFHDRLNVSLEHANRSGRNVTLLLVDLDGFKRVNDTLGHHVGDLLLQHVAKLLRERVRKSDTVARTGGDEFSIVLCDTTREAGGTVKSAIGDLLSRPFELEGKRISIAASVGIAVYPEDAADADSLCIAADRDMYASKGSSRTSASTRAPQPIHSA